MVVMDLEYEDGRLWVLGEDRVSAVSEDGSVTGSYSLGRNYLKGCSFGGNGFAVLLLSRYRAGSAGQAVVVGPDGTETASLTLPANVLDLDAAGRYGPAERRAAGGVYLGHDAVQQSGAHPERAAPLAV